MLIRPRRNRKNSAIRSLVAETQLQASDFILPIFVVEGQNIKQEIPSLPNVFRYSIDSLLVFLQHVVDAGILGVALFPQISDDKKMHDGGEAYNPDNLISRTIKAVKDKYPDLLIVADIALDPYTPHGHDGIIKDNYVDNDITLEALGKQAVAMANAGADIVAPSDMMDFRVEFIRNSLDNAGHVNCNILCYSVKYASSFYGPFRDAVGSKQGNDSISKKQYQMDFHNNAEALREASIDESEGADMLMVKPVMSYLDIISKISVSSNLPVFAYHVSGEYAMLHAAAQSGWLDYEAALYEQMIAIKRAGASVILTYAALDIIEIINAA